MRLFGRVMLVLLASMFVWTGSVAAQVADEVVDQQNQTATSVAGCGAPYCGQTFTVGITGLLTRVELNLAGNSANSTVELRTVGSDGLPTNVVVATGPLPAGQTDWVSIPLTPQPSVLAGSRYAIIVTDPSASYRLRSGNPYSNGAVVYTDGSGNWRIMPELDKDFRTYVIPTPATSTPTNTPTNTPTPTCIIFTVTLDGAQEVPPTGSSATGIGTVQVDTTSNTLSFNIALAGLSSAETAAHLHGFAGPGVNAAVLQNLPSTNPKIGVLAYNEEQEGNILAGLTYINIHTTTFPGGEIRGQIAGGVSGCVTPTPTNRPTNTATPTNTSTPTITPTPKPGCDPSNNTPKKCTPTPTRKPASTPKPTKTPR